MDASPDGPLLAFFTAMDNQGGVTVRTAPKFDLDTYIQNYAGRTRFDRLFLIGRSSVPLCIDALKAANAEAKRGKDVQRYRDVWECLRIACPDQPEAVFDRAWADATDRTNRAETHRLEAELKSYKNNLVKESVRMGNEDLGQHLENVGDANGAVESYNRMRTDASNPRQIMDAFRHLGGISVQRRDWSGLMVNVNKIMSLNIPEDDKPVHSYIRVVSGIGYLGLEKYVEAARSFLHADSSASASHYADYASPNDVAIYGGLLALATMDRAKLQELVLDNTNFRTFLELEPHIRRAISQFVNGRYAACLAILESYRADYLLDIYLQKHIPTIYAHIRSKCIIQYLIPFSRVTLATMAASFAVDGDALSDELAEMIQAGILDARLDTIDQVVVTTATNPRLKMQTAGLMAAKHYEREALERIRRMNLATADLEVKGTRKGFAGGLDSYGMTKENWLDGTASGQ